MGTVMVWTRNNSWGLTATEDPFMDLESSCSAFLILVSVEDFIWPAVHSQHHIQL